VIVPLELGHLLYRNGRQLWEVLGRRGMRQRGKRSWRRALDRVVPALLVAFLADYVVLGGGNAKHVRIAPPGARLGNKLTAFRGGFRLWHLSDVPTLSGDEKPPPAGSLPPDLRLI